MQTHAQIRLVFFRLPALIYFVALAFFGGRSDPAFASPVTLDRLEASVNSSLILLSDVEHFRKLIKLRGQLDPVFSGTTVATKGVNSSPDEVVSFLIDENIISQAFPVTDAEAEQEVSSIQSTNHIDRTQLKAALAEQGFTFEDYFELIRASASKRNLIDRDIRTKVTITDDDIKNYYYSHYSQTATGNRSYTIHLIYLAPATYKTSGALRDAAQSALKAVQGGETFEEVAKRVSDDSSASSGGDLGSMKEDQMSPIIRDNLKNLQIGQTSSLLGDPKRGFYIVKLIDVKADDGDRLAKAKDEIRNQLVATEYQHQIQLWLERQKQSAFIRRAGAATPGITPETKQ